MNTANNTKKAQTRSRAKTANAMAMAIKAERNERLKQTEKWLTIAPIELKRLIENFAEGDFPKCAKTIQAIFENDAQIKTCIDKRVAMCSCSRWEVQKFEESAEAQAQFEALTDFFNTLKVNSVYAKDANGSLSDLVAELLLSRVYKYSAGILSYKNARTPNGRATYHGDVCFHSLTEFEAKARRLQIITRSNADVGEPLGADWIVGACSRPLAPSLLVLHFFKAVAEVDWSGSCERFGKPFPIVKTPAQRGTQEWSDAVALAQNIGAEYNAVVGSQVDVDVKNLLSGGLPHRDLVDYFDRAIARLVLGGDLDTMSRDGGAVGSMAQTEREDYLRKSDKIFVENIIDNTITKDFLRRVFPKSRPLVYLSLTATESRELDFVERSVRLAREIGLPIEKSWLYENLGIPAPSDNVDVINVSAGADTEKKTEKAVADLGRAQAKQFLPILEKLEEIRKEKDEKKAFLLASKLRANFDDLAQGVLANDAMGEVLARDVLRSVQDPLPKIKTLVEEAEEMARGKIEKTETEK